MKSGSVAVAFAGLVVLGGIASAFLRQVDSSSEEISVQTCSTSSGGSVVHVDDLARDPERYKGEIVLKAVVAALNRTDSVLAVIDSREFEACGVLTCARTTLPVKFSGKLPEVKTVVRVRGEVVRTGKGLVLQAKSVETVP